MAARALEIEPVEQGQDAAQTAPGRLLSVDVFRGLAVAGMLLVDYQGSGERAYAQLKHAAWNGLTAADLVFPAFLFLVGLSAALSVSARLARGQSRQDVLRHAALRAAILFVVGVLLNGPPTFDLATWRIHGVVQRIALCSLAAVVMELWLGRRALVAVLVACLVGYWALLRLVPVPGYGLPGREVPFLDPAGNLTAWLDRALFPGRLYDTVRDPEGLLSTLPSLGTALCGLLTGRWLLSARASASATAARLGAAGLVGLLAGTLWSFWFPFNKNLWTSSYVVFSAGAALVLLAGFHWIVEVRRWRGRWTVPFLVFGLNAILGYLLDMLLWLPMRYGHVKAADGTAIPWRQAINDWLLIHLSGANASLAYAIFITLVCGMLLYPLYRQRIFVKI
jgi:predicted acyltransferase